MDNNSHNIISILNIINNFNSEDNYLLALSIYINFYYEKIVSEPNMLEYIVNSSNQIDKLAINYPEYTRRQLESTYIALTLCLIIIITNQNFNLD